MVDGRWSAVRYRNMKTLSFYGLGLIGSLAVAVGLPMALGVFFRGFMKKSSINVPALMAASVLFSVQQFVVYRGDQRLSTVIPRVQAFLPNAIRHEDATLMCLTILLTAAGVGIPFIFARLGIRISDFIDQMVEKVKLFVNGFLHRKQ